ncbi:hypothetical protein F0562_014845 [Nyssa sinensis]|uniref:Uncharacterized protein n=1 Tax=Nyssa sinensis TaxID=561372 RepID=A0A5J4ZRE1_9ASTE|nr:hypothetical protein F0562_014845 [Nyssa sinensis]
MERSGIDRGGDGERPREEGNGGGGGGESGIGRRLPPVGKGSGASVGIDCEGKVVKTGGDVMSSAGVRIPVLVIVSGRRWSRRCGGVKQGGPREWGRKRGENVGRS